MQGLLLCARMLKLATAHVQHQKASESIHAVPNRSEWSESIAHTMERYKSSCYYHFLPLFLRRLNWKRDAMETFKLHGYITYNPSLKVISLQCVQAQCFIFSKFHSNMLLEWVLSLADPRSSPLSIHTIPAWRYKRSTPNVHVHRLNTKLKIYNEFNS